MDVYKLLFVAALAIVGLLLVIHDIGTQARIEEREEEEERKNSNTMAHSVLDLLGSATISDDEIVAEAALSEINRLRYNDQSAGTKQGIVPRPRPLWAVLVNPRRSN